MSKRVLVTGAGGYIGRHVTKALCDAGAEVFVADYNTEGIDTRAACVTAEIFSGSENIYQETGCPDVCVHLAWKDGFVHNSDAHMGMLSQHYTFLRNMMAGGLKQLAVMGTMHEVGYWEGAINENTPCSPSSMYGIAKDALRRSSFLLAQQYGVTLQWLRAYYIYGDDARNHSIFAKLTAAEELARQIAAVALQDEVNGIINCCSGQPMSLGDKVEQFIQKHGFKIKLDYGAFPDRPYDSPAVWGDASKIQKILN